MHVTEDPVRALAIALQAVHLLKKMGAVKGDHLDDSFAKSLDNIFDTAVRTSGTPEHYRHARDAFINANSVMLDAVALNLVGTAFPRKTLLFKKTDTIGNRDVVYFAARILNRARAQAEREYKHDWFDNAERKRTAEAEQKRREQMHRAAKVAAITNDPNWFRFNFAERKERDEALRRKAALAATTNQGRSS